MNANVPKRKIFDALDMLIGEERIWRQTAEAEAGGIQMFPIDKIRALLRLYEDE